MVTAGPALSDCREGSIDVCNAKLGPPMAMHDHFCFQCEVSKNIQQLTGMTRHRQIKNLDIDNSRISFDVSRMQLRGLTDFLGSPVTEFRFQHALQCAIHRDV